MNSVSDDCKTIQICLFSEIQEVFEFFFFNLHLNFNALFVNKNIHMSIKKNQINIVYINVKLTKLLGTIIKNVEIMKPPEQMKEIKEIMYLF